MTIQVRNLRLEIKTLDWLKHALFLALNRDHRSRFRAFAYSLMIGLENLKSNPRTAAARDHHPHYSFCTHLYHGRVVVYRPAFWFYGPAGAMSLAGMMIKNAIVLLDQVNIEQAVMMRW